MKSIRETVMSKKEEPIEEYLGEYSPRKNKLLGDDYDKYDYPEFAPSSTYNDPVKGQITITFNIENEEIGKIADDSSASYDWDKASSKATEIAHNRIEELLDKNYKSKYQVDTETCMIYNKFEITVTLKPKKNHA